MKSEFDVIAWWISFFTSGVFATTFFWYAPKLMLSPQMRLWSCFAFTHVRANYARVSDRRPGTRGTRREATEPVSKPHRTTHGSQSLDLFPEVILRHVRARLPFFVLMHVERRMNLRTQPDPSQRRTNGLNAMLPKADHKRRTFCFISAGTEAPPPMVSVLFSLRRQSRRRALSQRPQLSFRLGSSQSVYLHLAPKIPFRSTK